MCNIYIYSIYYISIEIDGWRCYLYTHWATGPYIWSVGWSSPAGWGTGRFRSDTSVGGNGGAAWAATLQFADRWSGTASLRRSGRRVVDQSEASESWWKQSWLKHYLFKLWFSYDSYAAAMPLSKEWMQLFCDDRTWLILINLFSIHVAIMSDMTSMFLFETS